MPPEQSSPRRLQPFMLLCALLLATAALYSLAVDGPYFLDDFHNLVQNERLRPATLDPHTLREAAFSSQSGSLQRPVSMLSFALNYALAGNSNAAPLKAVNITIHLFMGLGLFLLARRLIPRLLSGTPSSTSNWIAVAVAGWWLLHPLHASTVLYAVQRMTQLSSLFMLLGALVYVAGRERMLRDNRGYAGTLAGVTIATLLAVFSKENGALLPTLLLVIEACAFRFALPANAPRWVRPTLYTALWLPTLAILAYLLWEYFRLANGVLPGRLFSLDERLMSEARILWRYLGWLFLLAPEGIGLFHDDIVISRGLFSPVTTAIASVGWIGALALAVYGLRTPHLRHLAFGILWFLAAHLLESTTLPLELAFEHRNYLAAFGPLLALGIVLARLRGQLPAALAAIVPAIFAGLIGLSGWLLSDQVLAWRSAPALSVHLVKVQPDSPRAWATLAQTLIERGQLEPARQAITTAQRLAPYEAGYPLGIAIMDCLADRPFAAQTLSDFERAIDTPPNTAYTTNQFQNFLTHCAVGAQRADADTLRIYAAIERSTDANATTLKAMAWYFHGRAHLHAGDRMSARTAWETVLKLDPEAVLPALDLATLYLDERADADARRVLDGLDRLALTTEELARLQGLRKRLQPQ